MGYRVAKALMREMDDELDNMKEIFAQVGTSTCAVDAIQKLTGCTLGKRNLIMSDLGKPVYILQNSRTRHAVRAYVHFWDDFNQEDLKRLKTQSKKDPQAKIQLQEYLDDQIDNILRADEKDLFSLRHLELDPPKMSGKFDAKPCESCGEFVNTACLINNKGRVRCKECC
jgi:formylmethanofuran dehydrogenase subunit E